MSFELANSYNAKQPLWSVSCRDMYIVTGGLDGIVQIWSQNEPWKEINKFEASSFAVVSVISLGNERVLALYMDGHMRVWNITENTLEKDIATEIGDGWGLAVNPQDLTQVAKSNSDGQINIWDIKTGEVIHSFEKSGKSIMCLAWSYDGKYIASGNFEGEIALFSAVNKSFIYSFIRHKSIVRSIAFSQNSNYLVTGSEDCSINIINVSNSDMRLSKTIMAHHSMVTCVAVFENYVLSSSYDSEIKMWNLESGNHLYTGKHHASASWGVAWNNTGKKFFSIGDDGHLCVYDMKEK